MNLHTTINQQLPVVQQKFSELLQQQSKNIDSANSTLTETLHDISIYHSFYCGLWGNEQTYQEYDTGNGLYELYQAQYHLPKVNRERYRSFPANIIVLYSSENKTLSQKAVQKLSYELNDVFREFRDFLEVELFFLANTKTLSEEKTLFKEITKDYFIPEEKDVKESIFYKYQTLYKDPYLKFIPPHIQAEINVQFLFEIVSRIKLFIKKTKKLFRVLEIATANIASSFPVFPDFPEENNSAKKIFNQCFIIHGHNDTIKNEVAKFVREELKKEAIILHEKANAGKTVIEKFEYNAKEVDFAIAIWSADDKGKGVKDKKYKSRARQNVIFETGFFFGQLGRHKVIVIMENGIDEPSDYRGVVYSSYNGNWKDDLKRETEKIYQELSPPNGK